MMNNWSLEYLVVYLAPTSEEYILCLLIGSFSFGKNYIAIYHASNVFAW